MKLGYESLTQDRIAVALLIFNAKAIKMMVYLFVDVYVIDGVKNAVSEKFK